MNHYKLSDLAHSVSEMMNNDLDGKRKSMPVEVHYGDREHPQKAYITHIRTLDGAIAIGLSESIGNGNPEVWTIPQFEDIQLPDNEKPRLP